MPECRSPEGFSLHPVLRCRDLGSDNNGDKADAVINIASCLEKVLSGVRIDAAFPQRSMLRYLVVTCPEGLLSTLSDFDVRGQSFVFS